jgi:hypothetical protein
MLIFMPMIVWWVAYAIYIVIVIAMAAAMYLLTPGPKKPKSEDTKLEVPTVKEGKSLGLLYGTELIKDLNVVNYWKLRIVTIEKPGPGKKQ